MHGIATLAWLARNDMRTLPVIASVAKQSPAWNKYSNYSFLPAEIAAGTAFARNDGIDPNSSDYPH